MSDLRELRRSLIISHRDFCCPVTGEILDVDDSHIVKFYDPKTMTWKTDVISANGCRKLKAERLGISLEIVREMSEL